MNIKGENIKYSMGRFVVRVWEFNEGTNIANWLGRLLGLCIFWLLKVNMGMFQLGCLCFNFYDCVWIVDFKKSKCINTNTPAYANVHAKCLIKKVMQNEQT